MPAGTGSGLTADGHRRQSEALVGNSGGSPYIGIADVSFCIDRIIPKTLTQLLAQLADVALDDAVLDVIAVDPIDRIKDLFLGEAVALLANQVLEDVPLASRKSQRKAIDLRVAAVEEDLEPVSVVLGLLSGVRIHPTPDSLSS